MLKRWQFWLGVMISAVFLYFALRGLELDRAWLAMRTANYWWIIPGVVVYFFGVWARTWRWHYMLRPLKHVGLAPLFPIVCIGYMGNNIYPARAGEVIRSYVLRRKEGVSMSASLATVVVERIFDGVVMLLFVFVALPLTPMPLHFRRLVVLFSVLFFTALLIFLILAAQPTRAAALYNALAKRFLPERIRLRTDGLVERFLEGLASLRSFQAVLMIFVTSVVIWLAETVKYWFVMHAFPFSVPFYVLMLMNGLVNLATTLPAAPGYVGTFDEPGIEVLKAFGVNPEVAAGYTFVLHAALWFPITVLGAYYFRREQLAWRDFALAEQAQRGEVVPE